MATNDYGIEITDDLRREGQAAAAAIEQARVAWDAWVVAVTGAPANDNTGEHLADAADEAGIDVIRFTSTD